MTQKWKPVRDWSDSDGGRKWLNALLFKIERSRGVSVHYELERCEPGRMCSSEFGDFGTCSHAARYVVLVSTDNTFKGAKRENRVHACSLRHLSRRVRGYFGFDGAAVDIDEQERSNAES